jgi:hypothetical protein
MRSRLIVSQAETVDTYDPDYRVRGDDMRYNRPWPWTVETGEETAPLLQVNRGYPGPQVNGVLQDRALPTPIPRRNKRGNRSVEYTDMPRFRDDLGTPVDGIGYHGFQTGQTHQGNDASTRIAAAPQGRQSPVPVPSLMLRVVPTQADQSQNAGGNPPPCP